MHIYMYIYISIDASRRWTPTLEMYLYKFPVWGPTLRCIYPPNQGTKVPSGVQSSLYVCPSVCHVVRVAIW